MPSQTYQEIPLTFEKGLVLETEESVLGEGMSAALTNWTPEHTGGLRARNHWRPISTTGFTDTTYNCRGWGSIGVNAAPAVVQYEEGATSVGATEVVSLENVQAGSTIFVLVTSQSYFVSTPPSGYTEQAGGTGLIRNIYSKVSSGGTETASVVYTFADPDNRIWMFECVNVSPSLDAESEPTSGGTSTSATPSFTTDSTFVFLSRDSSAVLSGANTAPTQTFLINNNENATGASPYSAGFTTSSTLGTNTYTWTNQDTGTISVGAYGFKGINRSTRAFYVVMANAITDAKLHEPLTATFIGDAVSGVDATTYATGSFSPSLTGVVLFAVVASSKAASPDTPTLSGTNAFSNTWTQISTAVNDTRRVTAFWSTAASTTAGTVTAAFGGATQTGGNIALFEMSASDISDTSPTVQAVTATGTGTSVSATLAAFADSTNIPMLFMATAATAAGTMTATEDLTEIEDDASGEMAIGAFVGYDSDNLTPTVTLSGSVAWAAIAVEVSTTHTGAGYRIWQIPRDELASGTWELVDYDENISDTSSLVSFAQGAGYLVWTSDQMNYPRSVQLATGNAADITDVVGGGRAVVYHKNRFFMTGSANNPSRVYFSDLASATSWGVNSYFDLNADDGETAEDMASVEGLLLVVKTNQTFLISGSGIESFFVNSLSGGSSATGRSLAKTPYGTILAGANELWSVQGGGIDPLSRPLGNGYAISGYVSSAYASDKAYVLDSGTSTIYMQDLVTGSFALESVTHTDTPHLIFAVERTLLYGTDGGTTYLGGFRSLADTRVGDATATTTTYTASSPLTFLLGPQVKYTPRHLFLQVRRQVSTAVAPLTVTVETSYGSRSWDITPNATVTRERLDIGFAQGQSWVQVHFSQTVDPSSGPTDIERVILGVEVERVR